MTQRTAFLVLCALVVQTNVVACCAESVYSPPDCGTNALYLLMKHEGRAKRLNEIQTALPPPHELGYSMLELKSAAKACGLNLVGVKFGPGSVPLLGPVIAHRPGHKPASGHFVVLRPVGSNNTVIQVIDPPYAPQLIDYPALFGGKGEPVMILRPATIFETWTTFLAILLLGVPCVILLAVRLIIKRQVAESFLARRLPP
jgi:Peptidase C39 family